MNEVFPSAADLLPHQGRAVLIDKVLMDTENSIRVTARISSEHPFFVTGHGVPSWVGIELMAQAIAAHAGIGARRSQQPPRVGMLLGTRRFHTGSLYFRDGARLEILAEREYGDAGGIAACACTILCEGRTLAKATLIIVEIGQENI